MPLHRDIHWLGRQWAVTGHGLQLINQKQMGYYDIEAARLWEARVTEIQSKVWIDRPDFDKALEIARGKFAHLAPADLPAPVAVAPPPPVRATPPVVPRAPRDAESVPSIEELLARLKSKSAAAAPIAKPVEEAAAQPPPKSEPTRPEPPKPDTPKLEPRGVEPVGPALPKSELPNAPRPELLQAASANPELLKPESRKVGAPAAEAAKPAPLEPEPLTSAPGTIEPAGGERLKSEAPTSEVRQTAPVKKPEAPAPVVTATRRSVGPAWPVFDRKIAGSGRFVHPWRVASARWQGPGLPPRS